MITNWPYAILGELLKQYGESPTDLSRFLADTVGIPKDDVVRANKIKTILNYLQDENYLTWEAVRWLKKPDGWENWDWDNKASYKIWFGSETRIGDIIDKGTLGNTRIEGHLTMKGLEFATNIVRSEQLHSSTIATNKVAIGSGIAAAIFAGLTVFVSTLQYCNQPKSISPDNIRELKEELSKIAQQRKAADTVFLKNPIDPSKTKNDSAKTND